MGRRRGFFAELEHQRNLRMQQAAREQRERDRLIAQTKRERERLARAAAQADKQAAKQAAAQYLQVRQAEVVALNHGLTERIAGLDDLLVGSLRRSARIQFAAARADPADRGHEPQAHAARVSRSRRGDRRTETAPTTLVNTTVLG